MTFESGILGDMKTVINTVVGVFIGLLVAGLVWNTARQPRGEPVTLQPPPSPEPISVHVTGAVVNPGVYELPQESRVSDAIDAAGGFLPVADREQINLAALLKDGMQLKVETRSFYNTGGGSGSQRMNINTATAEELDTLPGIGPSTAQAIVNYRRQFGEFQRADEITNVEGIGPATYDRIKDLITVD
jgi:competence protein ComEA